MHDAIIRNPNSLSSSVGFQSRTVTPLITSSQKRAMLISCYVDSADKFKLAAYRIFQFCKHLIWPSNAVLGDLEKSMLVAIVT